MSDSVQPHRQQPTRLFHPWDSPGKNTSGLPFPSPISEKWKVKSLSCVRLFATPYTAAHQAPLPMGFSWQEYWGRLPLPSPEPSLGVPKYIKKTLTNIKEIDSNTIIVRGCNTPLTEIAYPDRKLGNTDLKWHIIFDGLNRCIEGIQSKNNIHSFQVHREILQDRSYARLQSKSH